MWQSGATPHRGARASHHRGLSRCGAQAPDAQAQQLWPTGPAAPRHAGSSQTRARICVPCIGRQILNHCATREALYCIFKSILKVCFFLKFLFIYLFIYLFLAVLGLHFCARAFPSCGERGPLLITVRGPLTIAASLVAEHRLQT